ncbi:MAG: MASE1 domain-containing protein [Burkholderiales bacterium]|jgi:diguanylate cyclase (GGDEF)-like protein
MKRAETVIGVPSLALLTVVYFAAARLGLQVAYLNPSATPVWPPTGIALAALLVLGYRVSPAIWLGAFLANLATTGSLVSSAGIAVGNTAEALAGAWLVNRFAGGRHAVERSADLFKFAVLAAVSTSISATLGVLSLSADGFVQPGTHGAVWLTWWLGDLVGALIVAPLVLLWSADWRLRFSPVRAGEATALLLAVLAGGLVMFGGFLPPFPLTFLALPLLLWPAFRFGSREAVTVAALLGVIAVAGTLRGVGSFAGGSPNHSLLLLQSFMGVSTLTALAVAGEVAERKRLEARLSHLADYDSLTDVLSRRRFQEQLEQQLADTRRYGTPAALLFVDMDDFKSVNDRFGHAAGDKVLANVAALLRGRLRDSDSLGRIGGDEFVVLLPHADREQAETVAAQLLMTIATQPTVLGETEIRSAASIGIELLSNDGQTLEEVLAHADDAMFAAKAAGHNTFRVYDPEGAGAASKP